MWPVAPAISPFALSRPRDGQAHGTVLDINGSMLGVGAERAAKKGYADNLDFVEANAEELPFEDASFDAYTIAFGIRNVPDIDKALARSLPRSPPRRSLPLSRIFRGRYAAPRQSL
jgi:2-polyprenyl-3-methyl-5-hydroxy-6-metoxy-1,4-benzoquinol methylase